ncbi:MAG: YbaK/EbsC family protein [Merdibacter sp.]
MSIENVREYLKQYGKDHAIIILDDSSATVELAAKALHTETMRIAKSLSFMVKDKAVIIVCAGDCRIDNHKYKEYFHVKARMLKPDEVEKYTNHPIGGVCPFAVPETTSVYLDVSLQRFDYFYPACGSRNSAIRLTCGEITKLVPQATWIDVCRQ